MSKKDSCSPEKSAVFQRLAMNLSLAQIMFQEECTAEIKICVLRGVKSFAQFAPEALHQKLWDESLGLRDTVPTLKWVLEDPRCSTSVAGLACLLPFIISTPVAGKARLPWQLYLFRLCFPLKRGFR